MNVIRRIASWVISHFILSIVSDATPVQYLSYYDSNPRSTSYDYLPGWPQSKQFLLYAGHGWRPPSPLRLPVED